ncbi:DUF4249 family protein [Mongoliitalea daihaiensis]|uniref:DUF4249 family protein n=1 Tax=Mongoliitalea daihaiensis TaxID=2782006 RepID=UPI001F3CC838|nr:DUF4249 family protein [Mongoliitalea daihaiensis]UJP66830.1 DUF4249 domain-containing protein [Mongoliitalea daihaiensis]
MKTFKQHLLSRLIWVCCLFLGNSCVDPLDFIGETARGQVVIYGLFTDDADDVHVVNVGITQNFGLAQAPVNNASVFLRSSDGLFRQYIPSGNGEYLLEGVRGNPGTSYSLRVVINEQIYESSFERMPDLNAVDQIDFRFTTVLTDTRVDVPTFEVFGNSTVPEASEPLFLRWSTEETYLWTLLELPPSGPSVSTTPPCFIQSVIEPNRVNLFNTAGTQTRAVDLFFGRRDVDDSFLNPFFVTVNQYSINQFTYEYWEKIRIAISNQGGIFDTPPAPVSGNFQNISNPEERVLGIFEVAKVQKTRFFTTIADVPFFLPRPCIFSPTRPVFSYPSSCLSCEERAEGRKIIRQRPSWWVFG